MQYGKTTVSYTKMLLKVTKILIEQTFKDQELELCTDEGTYNTTICCNFYHVICYLDLQSAKLKLDKSVPIQFQGK